MYRKRTFWNIFLKVMLVAVLITADQIVKNLAENHVISGSVVPLIKGIVDLTFTRNTGAAFSMFPDSFWFLLIMRFLASGAIIFIMIRFYQRLHTLLHVSMSLVLAGAIGNLIDQIFWGHVRDMFAFHFINFPVFNLADICITTGAVLLFADLLFFKGRALFAEQDR